MKITQNQQIAIGVVAVVAVGTILYFVLRKKDDSEYLDDPISNPNNPSTFSPTLAAERLYDAMKESGTNEKEIMSVLQTISVANMPAVFGKFGKRSYNKLLGNQINFNPLTDLPLEPLNIWFKKELSSSSYQTIRMKYQSLNLF